MTVNKSIINKINRCHTGSVFFANSFSEFDEEYVGKILSSLTKDGVLSRVGHGIYVKPMKSKFGAVMPPTWVIVKAIAKRDNAEIMVSGDEALNLLGLSSQVPTNAIYLTSGTARKLIIDGRSITLRHVSPSNFIYKGELVPVIVQALRAIGEASVDENIKTQLRNVLEESKDEHFEEDVRRAPVWMKSLLMQLKKEIVQ